VVGELRQLPGDVDDPASEAIPVKPFVARPDDYAEDAAGMEGVFVSFNTLLLAFAPDVTVGDANALLTGIGATIVGGIPGVEGEAAGIVVLRVPITDHVAMNALITTLEQDPRVLHVVQDALLETTALPVANDGDPADWTWQLTPTGGNYGLELIRVPQMWNLNAALAKAGASTPSGVLDTGFADPHEDLAYDENQTPGTVSDHGTHVAGTVAAVFDNGVGVDGVNPFADLVVRARDASLFATGTVLEVRTSFGEAHLTGLFDLIHDRRDVRVINISLGYNWGAAGVDQDTSVVAQDLVEEQGALFALAQLLIVLFNPDFSSFQDLPMLVVAAGNDSNFGYGTQQARWASPFAYAGLEYDLHHIVVVESVANSPGGTGGATRSNFSNVGGTLSAPGSNIRSTLPGNAYGLMSGTSMAAPHVTGLVGYLLAVDPTLTHAEVRSLLIDNGIAVAGGASDRIDAFAAAMDIDRINGDDAVLRTLLDIDDGTPDGNQRRMVGSAADFLGEDADGDGGVGDGRVDMSDFRRFSDWLLQTENPAGLDLDGSASHPKKDVNGDSDVGSPAEENVYPRGDFNGDGRLSRTATRAVPGAVNATVSDLQVLQRLFDDPNYDATDLPSLLDSGDLEIWPRYCLDRADVVRVESAIIDGETTVETRTHTAASGPRQVYTAGLETLDGGYVAVVRAYGASDVLLFETSAFFAFAPGSDAFWNPACGTRDVALLYANERQAAIATYVAGLESRDFDVTPVLLGSSESSSASQLGAYDLLLIDTFSGDLDAWSGDDKVISAIQQSGRPVVGLGEGGYAYFGQVQSPIGYPNGQHGSDLIGFAVVTPTHPSLIGPRKVAIKEGTVQVTDGGTAYVGIFVPKPGDPLELVGRTGPEHYVVLIDGSRAGSALWGFHGVPSAYTIDGWNALANLMDYLISAR
jgi:subtilisin family serine protease